MATLPAAGHFTTGPDSPTGKASLDAMLAFTREMLGGAPTTELTIASGSITAVSAIHSVDTESDAASDTLTHIDVTGMEDGQLLLLCLEDSGRAVTIDHGASGAGEILLAGDADLVMDGADQWILLYIDKSGTAFLREVGRFGFDLRVVEASTAGTGAPNVLLASESGKTITNEGAAAAAYNTLPTARAGLHFRFLVQDATYGMVVTAATGDTIRVSAGVSTSGGTVTAADGTAGPLLHLVAINATEWVAFDQVGTWTPST